VNSKAEISRFDEKAENGTPVLDREDLVRRYNQPVPRYTSYPTALHFESLYRSDESLALLEETGKASGPLSLYVHLPFCRSLCWFCGCAKIISTQTELADKYLDYLEKELDLYGPVIDSGRKVTQLHFGGGTPNFLTPAQTRRLSGMLHDRFTFTADAEISVEIDPRSLDRKRVEAYRELGVNRASMGVQDVNPAVQKAIHRIQPSEMNRNVIAWLRAVGIEELNVDLIYGLPEQTPETFARTLEEVIDYDPDRLAVFSYAHVPWSKPAQKILEGNRLPETETKLRILVELVNVLVNSGYVHVGMDHFAKPTDPMVTAQRSGNLQRNFQGYSLHSNVEICAFGISAISQSGSSYRQNVKDLDTYYVRLDKGLFPIDRGYRLSADDLIRRRVIMKLMCDMALDFDEQGEALGIDFRTYFATALEALKPLRNDGLVDLDVDSLRVTRFGRLLIRNIAACFDAYLNGGWNGYSKAV